jgi:TetR/AcrR family transcriptional repressor of nem operon
MPYPSGHRTEVERKIVESARKLFNRHGFDGVSLHQIMAGAGLTHGGFYSYFQSKSDLYAEVLGCFFTDPHWKNCWEGVEVDLTSSGAGEQVIHAYLSDQHLENVANSCPMVALPSDVARSGPRAKRAFQTVFQAMVDVLNRSLPKAQRSSRPSTAQAIAALCVGGMVVARAIADRAHADSLRESCMSIALNLGGWQHHGKSKNRKSKSNGTSAPTISSRRSKAISASSAA